VVVSTFHSLGVRMLRQDGTVMGLKPNFCKRAHRMELTGAQNGIPPYAPEL